MKITCFCDFVNQSWYDGVNVSAQKPPDLKISVSHQEVKGSEKVVTSKLVVRIVNATDHFGRYQPHLVQPYAGLKV